MNILFISSNRIGDVILSTGLLRHLVETHPGAHITVACGPLCVELFAAVPGLQRIIPMQKMPWNKHWWHLWRAVCGTSWDIVVDLRNSLISRLLCRKKLYAFGGGDEKTHKVIQNGAVMGLNPPPAPQIWLSDAMLAEAKRITAGEGPILALAPAANWWPKQWPPEHFAALIGALLAQPEWQGARVMILAAAHEKPTIQPVIDAVPPGRVIEVIGGSLALAAACLKHARLFVGNDSGLMHLAAAVGTLTLGLFGPGYEKIYGPWGAPGQVQVLRTPESREDLLAKLSHPGAHEPNLMASLPPAQVVKAVGELLKNRQ